MDSSDDEFSETESILENKDIDSISLLSTSISNDESYIKNKLDNINYNPYITKFEKTKILSIRTQQISKGAPILIDLPNDITDPYDIAMLEYNQNKTPFIIRRYWPNNKFKDCKINDLIDKHN